MVVTYLRVWHISSMQASDFNLSRLLEGEGAQASSGEVAKTAARLVCCHHRRMVSALRLLLNENARLVLLCCQPYCRRRGHQP